MVKVIVVNGKPGCGKTTFETLCVNFEDEQHPVHIISTIDHVKNCARKIGWKGEKTPKDRKFLSELKRIMKEYDDSPYQEVMKQIRKFARDYKYHIVFIDSREPNEIERFVREVNATTLFITRPGDDVIFNNPSDDNVFDCCYNYVIENASDLETLKLSAKTIMEELRKGEFILNGKLDD